MNDRRQQTLTTTEMRDGDYDEEDRTDTMTTDNRASGSTSTADMAAAMEGRRESTPAAMAKSDGAEGRSAPLFAGAESETFRSRWTEIQTGFVDEPRHAVEEADGLVAEVVQRLVQTFADERTKLEQQCGKGDDVSTEDLRVSLQRYRSFFERLLTT
jgi:hypothetical protein